MSANTQHIDQNICDLEVADSVMGSAKACANISKTLDHVKQTTAACLSGPLSRLAAEFRQASVSYENVGFCMQSPEPVWNHNVALSVNFTQNQCQQIAGEILTILERHGQWTVKAQDGSCYRLNVLSKRMRLHRMYHELMVRTLKLVESPDREVVRRPAVVYVDAGTSYRHRQSQRQEAVYALWKNEERACSSDLARVDQALEWTKKCSKELRDFQVAEALPQTTESIGLPMMDDWSTTQSTTGIMTPTEDWSDLGSDTPEIGHIRAITRHSLQLCGHATSNFLRLIGEIQSSFYLTDGVTVKAQDLQRLHKAFDDSIVQLLHALDAPVPQCHLRAAYLRSRLFLYINNVIEESFGHLSGSTPVGTADIEAVHKAFGKLVERLLHLLAAPVPFQNDRFAPAPVSAPVLRAPTLAPAPEIPRPAILDIQTEIQVDRSLEAIINSMEPTPTDRDITKLVFHWTTLEEYHDFKRAEVMQFD